MIKELSTKLHCVISGFRREVDENSWILDTLKMGTMGWPETFVKNYTPTRCVITQTRASSQTSLLCYPTANASIMLPLHSSYRAS
jgi:hypothetical protein